MGKTLRFFMTMGSAVIVLVGGASLTATAASSLTSTDQRKVTKMRSQDEVREKGKALVPVSVTYSSAARKLSIDVKWNKQLQAEPGRKRFVVRVMAGDKQISQRVWTSGRSDQQILNLKLTPADARSLNVARKTSDAVIAVTQQADSNLDSDMLFEKNYVTVIKLPSQSKKAVRSDPDCSATTFGPSSNLSGCDFQGANMENADLYMADLYKTNASYANLSGASLISANLTSANFYKANMSNVEAAGTDWDDVTCPNGSNAGNPGVTCGY